MQILKDIDAVREVLSSLEDVILVCAEQSLTKFICLVAMRNFGQTSLKLNEPSVAVVHADSDSLLAQLQYLKKAIDSEELASPEIERILSSCQDKIKQQRWEDLQKSLEELRRGLVAFDITEMLYLVDKTDSATNLIKDRDIVLLLGGTGAGKSTTIQYLAGSKMERKSIVVGRTVNTNSAVREYVIFHIEATEITNVALKEVKSSYAAQSETRYIAAVPVKPTDVKPRLKEEAILCDIPGFADSRGPEIDVANGVGFVRAVRACKSVRLFILFDGKGLSDLKYKALKTVMITLSGLIPDVNKYLDTFLYGFTKSSEEEAQKLIGQLINFRDTGLKHENEHKEMLEAIVYDMINKFDDDDNVFVDPLDEKPGNVFKKIMAQPPIKKPQSVFRFSASEVSYSAIQDQIRRHQVSIMSAVRRSDYSLVAYKLGEIRKLNQVLEFPFIAQVHQESEKQILTILENKFSANLSHLERMMSDGHSLTLEDIAIVTLFLNEMSVKTDLQQELPTVPDYTTQLSQQLVMKSEALMKRIEEEDALHSEKNQLRLEKLKALSKAFVSIGKLSKYYNAVCQLLAMRYTRLSIGAQESINSNNFDELCRYCSQLKSASIVLSNHIASVILEERYTNVGVKLSEHFDLKLKQIVALFEQPSFSDEDIFKVASCLKLLQIAKNAEGLKAHFPITEITEREQFLVEKIKTYVDCLHTKIAQSFNADTEKALVQVEPWFKLMKTLCEMPGLPREIEKSYEKTKLLVLDRARALGGRFAGELKSIQEGTKVDYRYLAKGLQGLKQAAWVDQIAPGAYQSVLVEIEEAITAQIEQMEAEVTALDLPLDNEDGIKTAQLFCETLESMKPLDKTIESIGSFRARILLKIEEAIGATLKSVDKVFSLDGLGLSDLEDEIRRLISDMKEYETLLPASLYLSKKGYDSVEALETEIDKKEIYLKNLERKSTSKISTCIEDEKVLHDIYMKHADLLKSSGASGVFSLRRASPADTFLKENGFLSYSDLIRKLGEKEKEKNKFHDEADSKIQKIKADITRLSASLKQYGELRYSMQVSEKAKNFLTQRGYGNLENLKKKLIEKEKVLTETLSQGIRYQFTKLDATAALRTVDYLVWAKSLLGISPTFRRAVIESSEKLTTYLKHYMEFLEGRVQHYLSNINGHLAGSHSESKKIFEDCQLLLNRLQEIKELRLNYKSLFAYFKNPTLLEYCSHELDQIALDREGLMQTYSGAHDVANINKNLLFMKALSQLDEFSTFTQAGSKFIEIYRKYRKEVPLLINQIKKQAMNAISEHRYDEFAALMAQLESAGTQPAILNQLKQTLNNSLLSDAEETKMKAILLGHDIKEEWMALVISLRDNLEIIKKALMYVPQYLGVSQASLSSSTDKIVVDIYNETIQFVKEQLSERVIKAMDNISASIGGGSFAQAEEKMAIIKKAKNVLGSYLSQKAIDKVESFSTDLDKNLNALVDFYEGLELSDYYRRPPKKLYESVQQAYCINIKYMNTWEKIENVIINKLKIELGRIEISINAQDSRRAINVLLNCIEYLPGHLQNHFIHQIEFFKDISEIKINYEKKSKVLFFTKTDRSYEKITSLENSINETSKEKQQKWLNCTLI